MTKRKLTKRQMDERLGIFNFKRESDRLERMYEKIMKNRKEYMSALKIYKKMLKKYYETYPEKVEK